MRLSTNALHRAVAGVALGAWFITSRPAFATFVYDLRFDDGTHVKFPLAGTTYTLELYGLVSGTNGINSDETLTSNTVSIVSIQSSGGGLTSGGITSATIAAPFNGGGSHLGATNIISPDGISDWGGTSSQITATNYMFARTPTIGGEPAGGTVGRMIDANTWEFKIATFTVSAPTVGAGLTRFVSAKPIGTSSGLGHATYIIYKEDGVIKSIENTSVGNIYSDSTGVSFAPLPEPSSLGLIGSAAIGLLRRRRAAGAKENLISS